MYRNNGDIHQPKITCDGQALFEAKSDAAKVDYILKAGLAKNPDKIMYYRKVIADPRCILSDATTRPYAAEMLSTLLGVLFSDTTVWNRVKTILTRNKKNIGSLREDISDTGLNSLVEKAMKFEIPLEIVLEVYSRGAEIGGEKEGFGRVNSFLAGGKAYDLDSDLIRSEPVIHERNTHQTLSTIKRVLKEGKNK